MQSLRKTGHYFSVLSS